MLKKILKFCSKHDVVFHTSISCAIVLVLSLVFKVDIVLSCWITMAVGICKEYIDYFRGGYGTAKDLICDLIGIVIGSRICEMI